MAVLGQQGLLVRPPGRRHDLLPGRLEGGSRLPRPRLLRARVDETGLVRRRQGKDDGGLRGRPLAHETGRHLLSVVSRRRRAGAHGLFHGEVHPRALDLPRPDHGRGGEQLHHPRRQHHLPRARLYVLPQRQAAQRRRLPPVHLRGRIHLRGRRFHPLHPLHGKGRGAPPDPESLCDDPGRDDGRLLRAQDGPHRRHPPLGDLRPQRRLAQGPECRFRRRARRPRVAGDAELQESRHRGLLPGRAGRPSDRFSSRQRREHAGQGVRLPPGEGRARPVPDVPRRRRGTLRPGLVGVQPPPEHAHHPDQVHGRPGTDGLRRHRVPVYHARRRRSEGLPDVRLASLYLHRHGELDGPRGRGLAGQLRLVRRQERRLGRVRRGTGRQVLHVLPHPRARHRRAGRGFALRALQGPARAAARVAEGALGGHRPVRFYR